MARGMRLTISPVSSATHGRDNKIEDGSKWIGTLVLAVIVGIAGWPAVERMRNEITVYNMSCTKGRVNGECKSEEQTANPTSFKVYPEQQSVVTWIGDGPVTRSENCAVRDVTHSYCRNGHFEHIMTDGEYISSAELPFIGVSTLFYQAARVVSSISRKPKKPKFRQSR
jgi:hypothetical protein